MQVKNVNESGTESKEEGQPPFLMGNVRSIGKMGALSTPDTYTYDLLGRLVSATVRKTLAQPHTMAYQYDVYGNLVGRTETVPSGQTSVFGYLTASPLNGGCGIGVDEAKDYVTSLGFTAANPPPSNNRLGAVTRGGTLTVNGTGYATGITQTSATLAYDSNGNVTDDGLYKYEYDALNRLVVVRLKSTNQLQAEYFYDAAGERAAVVQYTGGVKSAYTQYLRNGSQVAYEKTWALPGYTVSTEKTYITAGGRMAVTRQTVNATTTFTYYGTDHLSTVRATAVFSSAGVFQNATLHDFEPYGLELPQKDTTSPNTHKYTGQERDDLPFDSTTGTHFAQDYMHFRAFGTAFGRFMRPDSISGAPANPQSWNLYGYVGGNPTGFLDPTGHAGTPPQKQMGYYYYQTSSSWGMSWNEKAYLLNQYLWDHRFDDPGIDASQSGSPVWNSPDQSFQFRWTMQAVLDSITCTSGADTWTTYVWAMAWVYQADPSSGQSWFPDFLSVSVNLPIPTPWTFEWLGVGVGGSISRYGRVYFSPGIQIGKSFMGIPGISITPGYLDQVHTPSPYLLDAFLSGNSFNIMGGIGIGGGESWTPGSGFGTEAGVVTFPFGASWSYSFDVTDYYRRFVGRTPPGW